MLLTKWERLKRLWKIVLDSDKLSKGDLINFEKNRRN